MSENTLKILLFTFYVRTIFSDVLENVECPKINDQSNTESVKKQKKFMKSGVFQLRRRKNHH